jgi:hypothetical protein
MQRLLRLAAVCIFTATMTFAQGTVTDQQPVNSGAQPNGNSVNTSPNSNGSVPSGTQGKASRTPSAPNQSLPGDANPANASTSDGKANGRAVRGSQPENGATVTDAQKNPNGGDNSNNNGVSTDPSGNNPASGRDPQSTRPRTGGQVQWFWVALGLVLALFVIRMLMSRNRVRGSINRTDPALRPTSARDTTNRNADIDRNRDRIRRVG